MQQASRIQGKWGRYRNGNYHVLFNETDGTKIRIIDCEEAAFSPTRPENIDMKITDMCDAGCAWCHENSTPYGKHADVSAAFLNSLFPLQEVAIGGGNVLEHPDLERLLEKLRRQGCFASITVNQRHFIEKLDYICSLYDRNLVCGVGVSLSDSADTRLLEAMKALPTAVLHCINGILTPQDVERLAGHSLKLLILGYKDIRRGRTFKKTADNAITANITWLAEHLCQLADGFSVVSFDNLALEQLDAQAKLPADMWERFYMGDDGQYTFYIDAVEQEYAVSSVSLERFPIEDKSVSDMFFHICSMRAENSNISARIDVA